jgi:hypothetical protein
MWSRKSRMATSGEALTLLVVGALWAREPSIIDDFEKRVNEYASQHRTLAGELPKLKPTSSAEALADHERELAQRISSARQGATQGDIFTPAIAAEFRRLLAVTMQGPRGKRIRRSLEAAEPVQLALHVNEPYPHRIPLQSTPPSLLLNLPKLPKELEYRVVGHNLVLRDADANLIVDFIPDAVP